MRRCRLSFAGAKYVVAGAIAAGAFVASSEIVRADGKAPRGAPVVQQATTNWSGFYFGAQSGFQWSDFDTGYPAFGTSFDVSHDSWVVGGQIGIQHQFGNVVLGVEGNLIVAYRDDYASTNCPNATYTCAARFDDVLTIGPRIGLGPDAAEELARIVECHLEAVRIPSEDGSPSRIHRMCARVGVRLPELALLSMADVEAARGPAQSAARVEEHEQFVRFLLEQFFESGFLVNPILPVTADDLTEQFGVIDRRDLTRLRDALMDAFVDGEFESREEGLALAAEILATPGGRGPLLR